MYETWTVRNFQFLKKDKCAPIHRTRINTVFLIDDVKYMKFEKKNRFTSMWA